MDIKGIPCSRISHILQFSNDDELDAIRGFLESDSISPRFVNKLVQEYGDESIRVAFLIPEKPNHPCLDFLFRRHKGHFYRKRYPTISFLRLVTCTEMWYRYVSDTTPPAAAKYGWTSTSWVAALYRLLQPAFRLLDNGLSASYNHKSSKEACHYSRFNKMLPKRLIQDKK